MLQQASTIDPAQGRWNNAADQAAPSQARELTANDWL